MNALSRHTERLIARGTQRPTITIADLPPEVVGAPRDAIAR